MIEKKIIEDKLKSLGVSLGTHAILQPKKQKTRSIEEVITGQYEQTPYGDVFIIKEEYPLNYAHGNISFPRSMDFEMISRWAKISHTSSVDLSKIAFIDTETSGLSRGTGTFAFLIGLGFIEDGQFKLVQIFMLEPFLEQAALSALTRYLFPFEIIVSYNGKSFDVPILNSRHVIHGLSSPILNLQHIDLLHLTRKIYKNRLPSRRLTDLETQLLHYERGKEEVPGWLVPQIYKDYLNTGDPLPLSGVFYHNAVDIITLAAVFVLTTEILNQPLQDHVESLDLLAIGNIYEELGFFDKAIEIYENCLGRDLPQDFYLQTLLRFALMYKKAGEREKAVILWVRAANLQNVEACIELAKHFEHFVKELGAALQWTNKAFEILDKDLNPISKLVLHDIEHRQKRLIRKKDNDRIPIRFQGVKLRDLGGISEAFITSTSRSILPITKIDNYLIDSGRPGEITKSLVNLYRIWVQNELEAI